MLPAPPHPRHPILALRPAVNKVWYGGLVNLIATMSADAYSSLVEGGYSVTVQARFLFWSTSSTDSSQYQRADKVASSASTFSAQGERVNAHTTPPRLALPPPA